MEAEKLKKILQYNPDTGVFTWLVDIARHIKAGSVAGYKDWRGYIIIGISGKNYKAHRLAWFYMTGEWPENIDHKNRNKSDNRWLNFKNATYLENNKNKSIQKNNTSKVTGVSRNKRDKTWCAYISINEKRTTLGNLKDFFEAVCLRKSAENKHGYYYK